MNWVKTDKIISGNTRDNQKLVLKRNSRWTRALTKLNVASPGIHA
jgi:hypothetical protein